MRKTKNESDKDGDRDKKVETKLKFQVIHGFVFIYCTCNTRRFRSLILSALKFRDLLKINHRMIQVSKINI